MIDKIYSNPLYKDHREKLLCAIDLVIVLISFLIAYWVKIDFDIPDMENFNYSKAVWSILTVLVVYTANFMIFKIHKSLWTYMGSVESYRIGLSAICSTIVLLIAVLVAGLDHFYLGVTVIGGLLSALIMFNCRLSYRLYRKYAERPMNRVKGIIIGAGDGGYIMLKELQQNKKMNVDVVGFIDDKKVDKVLAGYKVLGDTYDLPKIVQKHGVQSAFIAIPSANRESIRRIYDICQSLKLDTKIMKLGDSLIESNETGGKIPVKDISIEDLLGRGEIHLDQNEIRAYLTDKVVAVTGAGGSIGSELCRQIVMFKPSKLVMIDINENALYMLEQEFNRHRMSKTLDKDIEIYSIITSIRELPAINDVFEKFKPSVVYHAAAHKHVPLMETRPMEAIKNNVFGTNNVINACINNNVEKFIMISTDKAVNPTNVMGATKRMTEMILQAYGNNGVTKMAAVRFGNVLGSNGSVIPIFKQQIEEGGPVTITDKNITRYFMTIPEAAQLVLQAGYYADKGEIFVLDMGDPVRIIDLAEKMIRLSGYKPYEEIDIIEIGLRPGEKMYEELRLDGETTIRTKNNLIFKNQVMPITIEEINVKLKKLSECICDYKNSARIKEVMLDVIKEKNQV